MTQPAPARQSAPSARPTRRRWRRLAGSVLLGLVLGTLLLGLYLNRVGIPSPIKDLVVAEFRSRGWNLEFDRMRLRWYRGLVIEQLHLQPLHNTTVPELFAEEAQLRVNHLALLRFEPHIEALLLRQGVLAWSPPDQATPATTDDVLRLTDLEFKLLLDQPDLWSLTSLKGRLLGVSFSLNGTLTNATDIARWPWNWPPKPPGEKRQTEWSKLLALARQFQFDQPAVLVGTCSGDGRDPASFRADLHLSSGRLQTPWATISDARASVELFPPPSGAAESRIRLALSGTAAEWEGSTVRLFRLTARVNASTNQPIPADVELKANLGELHHPLLQLTNATLTARVQPGGSKRWPFSEANLVAQSAAAFNTTLADLRLAASLAPSELHPKLHRLDLNGTVESLRTAWGQSGRTRLHARAVHPSAGALPASLHLNLNSLNPESRWGGCQEINLKLQSELPARDQLQLFNANLLWHERLSNLTAELTAQLSRVKSQQADLDQSQLSLQWTAPKLLIRATNQLYRGQLNLAAQLDALTRQAEFSGQTSFDLLQLAPFLNTNGRRWLAKYSYTNPPQAFATGRLQLPHWTNRQPDWRAKVLPTLSLSGGFQLGPGAYRNVPFQAASSTFLLTNLNWELPDLSLGGAQGALQAHYQSRLDTLDFQWRFEGFFDPQSLRPLVSKPSHLRFFDEIQFTTPPHLSATVRGRWHHPELLSLSGTLSATNLSFRGQEVTHARATVGYTNLFLSILAPEITRPGERGTALGVGIDFAARRLYLTNAFGNLNPQAVTLAIGEKVAAVMAPYQFQVPPTVRAQGTLDIRKGNAETDLWFEVDGGPFTWRHCRLDQVRADLYWSGNSLHITNIQAQLGPGSLAGETRFLFDPTHGAQFAFRTAAAGVELQDLIRNLFQKTNRVEGIVSGELVITNAFTIQTNSWMGHGTVDLRDGLLWDIPLLGVFSPVLNAFFPGLGNSRARHATAFFSVSNSVAFTRNLAIDATGMRMQYQGAIGFNGQIDGRMEAELLRNLPGIGLVVSRILWPVTKIFEYRITGTLAQPETDPLFIIPRVLLLPLQPIKTIRDLIPAQPPEAPPPP